MFSLAALTALAPAEAALLTTEPVGAGITTLGFDAYPTQVLTFGPVTLLAADGAGVRFTASNPDAGTAGFSGEAYGLGRNGLWYASSYSYAWMNGDSDGGANASMRFTFLDGPVSVVGGFMNYVPDLVLPYYDPSVVAIVALDASGAVLESYGLESEAPINTPLADDDGAWRGIVRDSADIAAFEFRGPGVIRTLAFGPSAGGDGDGDGGATPVPEPNALALVLAAAASLAWRRRQSAS